MVMGPHTKAVELERTYPADVDAIVKDAEKFHAFLIKEETTDGN